MIPLLSPAALLVLERVCPCALRDRAGGMLPAAHVAELERRASLTSVQFVASGSTLEQMSPAEVMGILQGSGLSYLAVLEVIAELDRVGLSLAPRQTRAVLDKLDRLRAAEWRKVGA